MYACASWSEVQTNDNSREEPQTWYECMNGPKNINKRTHSPLVLPSEIGQELNMYITEVWALACHVFLSKTRFFHVYWWFFIELIRFSRIMSKHIATKVLKVMIHGHNFTCHDFNYVFVDSLEGGSDGVERQRLAFIQQMVVLSLSWVSGHPHKMELSRPYRDLYITLSSVTIYN